MPPDPSSSSDADAPRPQPVANGSSQHAIQLYLDLLKRTLTNYVYGDIELAPAVPKHPLKKWLLEKLRARGLEPMRRAPFDPAMRKIGRDLSLGAHSMIGLDRLDNLQHCMEVALRDGVPGDFIETGVWRGGATIFMRGLLQAYGVTDRRVWAADSFEGLPAPDADKYPADRGDMFHTYEYLRVSLPSVKRNFERYGLLDDQVQFLKGWFKDTLPSAPIDKLAVLRLDGDMYESTMDALTHLYPKLSPGGFVIVDDYEAFKSCKKAIHDYRDLHGITEEIEVIDWTSIFWRRSS